MAIQSQPKSQKAGSLEWRVWPAAQQPAISVAGALFCLAFSVSAAQIFEHIGYGIISICVLTISLSPHYFPTYYYLDEEKIIMRGGAGHIQKPWQAFRLAWDAGDRLILSYAASSQNRRFVRRNVILRLANNRQAVRDFVAQYLPIYELKF